MGRGRRDVARTHEVCQDARRHAPRGQNAAVLSRRLVPSRSGGQNVGEIRVRTDRPSGDPAQVTRHYGDDAARLGRRAERVAQTAGCAWGLLEDSSVEDALRIVDAVVEGLEGPA